MYTTGPKIKWFRRSTTRKSGPAPPHRSGHGSTSIKILRDGQQFYIGTEYVLSSGASKPNMRLSRNFMTIEDAQKYFQRMTGKTPAQELEEMYNQGSWSLCESIGVEKEIVLFDLRDACVNFLEEKGYFPRGKVPISMIIKIENFAHDLLHQATTKARDIEMKNELGFGIP
tara:strand:- start:1339 stop:1851 length:513 start_codon:yes stop_codon:yes gene_type:complete